MTPDQLASLPPEVLAPFRSVPAYIREFLWVKNKAGRAVPLVPNRTQRAIQRAKARAIAQGRDHRFLIPKARRMGVTTIEQAISFAACATQEGERCVTLAHTADATQAIFEMVQFFYEKLPEWVRPERKRVNRKALAFARPRSEFFIGTAGAQGFGRGDTLSRVHGSEVAFWLAARDQKEVENLIAGLTEAASHGEVVLESTANGDTGWWAETVLEAWAGGANNGNEWTVIFLPWWMDPTYRLPVTESEAHEIMAELNDREQWLVDEHGLDASQIAWRRWKNRSRSLRRTFLQEYPERLPESFLSSEQCFFDRDLLDMIEETVIEPRCEEHGVGIWEDPKPDRRYVIGADVAEGVPEGDYSAAYVLDFLTGTPVARVHRKCRPKEFARQLAKLGRHYNMALLGPERNNHGHVVVEELLSKLGYSALFYTRAMPTRGQAGARKRPTVIHGWSTDPITRPIMLDDLREAIEAGMTPRCGLFLAECRTFEDDGTGKYEARSGKHDDCVMAMAIALQVRDRAPAAPSVSFL